MTEADPTSEGRPPTERMTAPAPLPRATIYLRDIRRRALKRVAVGSVIAGAWVAFMLLIDSQGYFVWGPGLGLPCVPLLVGLAEVITGRSFHDLSRDWDELRAWQRGVFGLFIVLAAFVVIVVIAVAVITLMI